MKGVLALFFVFSVMIQAGAAATGSERTATGYVAKPGVTSFMYGTHVLKDETGKTLYALKSFTINLDAWAGKKVTVTGELIPGYPLEGGPEYLNVTSVQAEHPATGAGGSHKQRDLPELFTRDRC